MDATNTQDQGTQVQATQDQGTVAQATQATAAANGEATATATPAKLYPDKADAEANKPTDATKNHRPMECRKNGTVVGWLWARGYDHALAQLAKLDGYSVGTGVKQAPVTKEAVAAKLTEFTDAELAAMGLTRKPQRGGRK